MRRIGLIIGAAAATFGMTLALMIGARLSEQALSVVAGAACGAGALLPLLATLWLTLLRRRDEAVSDQAARSNAGYPPVIVIAPPASPALPAGQQQVTNAYGQLAGFYTGARQFSIIGASGEELTSDEYHNHW